METNFLNPPKGPQLTLKKLVRICIGQIKRQFVASILQVITIAATASFLTFVIGDIILVKVTAGLATADPDPQAKLAHLIWLLIISLLVCTISNVTSMLLSVSKRFQEIGTMKCLGAFDKTILMQFLIESLFLSLTGALIGAVAGAIFSVISGVIIHGPAILSMKYFVLMAADMIITLVTVMFLGFCGACYPSWQASRMLPIEAIRSNN
jgi:cell division protein FtsX